MSETERAIEYYVGWDVGGWNCDNNPRSRDAIVILNKNRKLLGKPWRGNLRSHINKALSTERWIKGLLQLCRIDVPTGQMIATMAIDTPLGFSTEFVKLVDHRQQYEDDIEKSSANPYLFRRTERFLFQKGLTPLSAVKDMIGSQATKGIHALAKFSPIVSSCGVWTDKKSLTVIEAYPSGCKGSQTIAKLRADYGALGHEDKEDAMICALIANLFAENRDKLFGPVEEIPASEGWIWIPADVISGEAKP